MAKKTTKEKETKKEETLLDDSLFEDETLEAAEEPIVDLPDVGDEDEEPLDRKSVV